MKRLAVALTSILTLAATLMAGPYDGQYDAYKVITVTPTVSGGDLASQNNFPLLVRFKSKNAATGADVLTGSKNGGLDIRFTDSTGSTPLAFERERWDVDSAADFWVRLPSINGTASGAGIATKIRVYYGKTGGTDSSSASAVFDTAAGFRVVYHMNGASANADENDATQNGFAATSFGASGATPSFGGIGGGRDFSTHTSGDSSYFLVGRTQSNFSVHMKSASTGVAVGIGSLAMYTTDSGATWSTRKTSSLRQQLSLNAVTCSPSNTNLCYAVGGGSIPLANNATRFIAKSTDGGNTWAKQDSAGTSQTFFGVSCNSDTSCVAVGGNTTTTRYYSTLSTAGASWATPVSATSSLLTAVYCIPDATDNTKYCYAVGGSSATVRVVTRFTNTGGVWTTARQDSVASSNRLHGIHCPTADICYAVGNAGTIIKTTDGTTAGTWGSPLTTGTTKNLSSIFCTDANTCVAVGKAIGTTVYVGGDTSVVIKTTDGGTSWAPKSVGKLNDSLYSVKFTSAGVGIIVGANGTVLRTLDGGETWTMNQNSRKLAMNVNGSWDFGSGAGGSGKGDNYSISSWTNVTATGGQRTVIGKGDFHWTQQTTSANLWNAAERNWMACAGTPATMCAYTGNTNWQNAEVGMTVTTGWHHVTSRRKNSVDSGMVYKDGGTLCGGTQVAATNASGGGVGLTTGNRAFLDIVGIGRGTDAYRRFWNRGSVDEIRVDGVDRTPSWVCLSYQTQTPDTAAYYGKVQMGTPVALRASARTGTNVIQMSNNGAYSFAIPAGMAESAELRIVDIAGRTVWSSAVRMNGKAQTISWNGVAANGSRATSGVYFARLKTVNQGKTQEFALKGSLAH